MFTRRIAIVVLVCITVGAIASRASAADDDKDWKVMGDASIGREAGTAEIKVGAEEGLAKRIRLEVRGVEVEIKKLTITYEEGDPEQVDVREKVRRGGKTRAIDLKGGNRVIKKVLIAFK